MNALPGMHGEIDSSAFALLLSLLDKNKDGKVDFNDLPEDVRSRLDSNADGAVDLNDLQGLLTAAGEARGDGIISLDSLTEETRSNLLSALQSQPMPSQGWSGPGASSNSESWSEGTLEVINQRLQSTEIGRTILQGLDTSGDGHLSQQAP